MRLQKIRTYYSRYLSQFYAGRPLLTEEPYVTQHRALMDDCFAAADFWSTELEKIGYQTDEIVSNSEPMQRRWATENGIKYDDGNWLLEITAAQIKAFRPTVLFVADYVVFTGDFLKRVRAENPSIQLVVGWCSAPYSDESVFHEYDAVLSCVPELVSDFRAKGHQAFHLNVAFAPQILERINTHTAPTTDFAFVGSLVKQTKFHNERERLLSSLVGATDLRIWAEVERPLPSSKLRRIQLQKIAFDSIRAAQNWGVPATLLAMTPFVRRAAHWKVRPVLPPTIDKAIAARALPALFGCAMYQQLHDSRVCLNTHIDISPVSASNMRLFEVTGVGSCLLTDWRANIATLFDPEIEVVTYRSPEECSEKAKYLLDHKDERQQIARRGQQRTLRDHTYQQWAAKFDEIVRYAMP